MSSMKSTTTRTASMNRIVPEPILMTMHAICAVASGCSNSLCTCATQELVIQSNLLRKLLKSEGLLQETCHPTAPRPPSSPGCLLQLRGALDQDAVRPVTAASGIVHFTSFAGWCFAGMCKGLCQQHSKRLAIFFSCVFQVTAIFLLL